MHFKSKYPIPYSCTNEKKCNEVDKTEKIKNKREYITNRLIRECVDNETSKKYTDSKEYIRKINIKNLCDN